MFEGSKREIQNNPVEQKIIDELFARRTTQLIAKVNISTNILWSKENALKSRKKGNEAFALKCDQVVTDMTLTYTAFDDMEKELRISRQRNAELEIQLLRYKTICEQQLTIIGNLEKELGF